ncbi:MAG: hypothetical protein HC769_15285 [Cyanobacteria bacterium CRU_2_1]|nr:hypothetical protein [Cyanobacteria bacterium RU_5_0]NJR60078.1 hypothetical protein [Cyanobacteria bacterium CRU_2_1]
MSIQKFSLEALKKVRRYVQDALSLADTERQPQTWAALDDSDELPEPESLDDLSGVFTFGGLSAEDLSIPHLRTNWFLSTVNPAAALIKLPGLRLKPALRLVSYLYRAEKDGVGLVFAVPEALSTTAQLEKALVESGNLSQPPRPEGALASFMEAIEGDRSPASFMIASLLRRELQDFGALGQQCNWSHHRLIDAVPPQAQWQWKVEQPPKDFSPKVRVLPDGQAAVEFFTCRVINPVSIYRHLDQYPMGQYRASSLDRAIAVIQR